MEITEEMYMQLQQQVKELQRKVNEIPGKSVFMTDYVRELPIHGIGTTDERVQHIEFRQTSYGDEWKHFIALAKGLCLKLPMLDMHQVTKEGVAISRKYKSVSSEQKLTLLNKMTNYEVRKCADFLNEVIPIYNKYFKEMHKTALVENDGNGCFLDVEIK